MIMRRRILALVLALTTGCALVLKPDGPEGEPPREEKEASPATVAIVLGLAAVGAALLVYLLVRDPKK
jgi:hypothetical protein